MANKVLTMGSFDLFHTGHLTLLQTCNKLAGSGGRLYIGINSDKFMTSFKRKPIVEWERRKKIISALFPRATIFSVDEHDASSHLVDKDFLVIGVDWAFRDYFEQIGVDREYLKERGVTLLYKEVDEDITTSELIERAKNAE